MWVPTMTIDAHHHFWRYNPEEYGWITDATPVLKRDYLPPDLQREISAVGIDGVISVQARQSLRETDWLLDLADQNAFIRGISALKDFDLRYDILIYERHLPNATKFVDRHPNQVFVLDHIAKPRIREHVVSPWKENLGELARRPTVYCKLSGMVTEADQTKWSPHDLQPYMEAALEAFTPKRLMFGSDWPVCLLASSYQRWYETVRSFVSRLSPDEQKRFWGETAVEAYGVKE